jgi:hypothetical protein
MLHNYSIMISVNHLIHSNIFPPFFSAMYFRYYGAMMQDRTKLINFYSEYSTMSYGGEINTGLKSIQHKIESFGFTNIVYQVRFII